MKPSLVADDTIIYIENLRSKKNNLLKLVSELSKSTFIGPTHKNQLPFYILAIKQVETEIKNTVSITINQKGNTINETSLKLKLAYQNTTSSE